MNLKTNLWEIFLKLVEKNFAHLEMLHKWLNKNNLKLSYYCMNKTQKIISKYLKQTDNPVQLSDPERFNLIFISQYLLFL